MWQVEQPVEGLRDFRDYKLADGSWQQSAPLTAQSPGVYVASAPTVTEGHYAAFFVQLRFDNQAELTSLASTMGFEVPDFTFTTGVRVVPDDYPEFTGYVANAVEPDAVPFPEETLPVIVAYGSPYNMGYAYGQLMADDINAFIPAYIEAWKTENANDDAFLSSLWDAAAQSMDIRILEEIQGISEAPGISVSIDQLYRAHAAMLYEAPGIWTGATASVYRDLMTGTDAAQSITVNGPAARDLHQYQCAVVYIPDLGAPHLLFTYAGLAIGHIGVNLGAISVFEIGDPSAASSDIFNAMPIMRTVLYDALNLRDGAELVKQNMPDYPTTVVLGDGRYELRSVRLRRDGMGGLEERYDLAPNVGFTSRGIIYAAVPLLENTLGMRLDNFSPGQLTIDNLRTIAAEPPFAETGNNLLNLVIDGEAMNIWLSTADGVTDAGTPNNILNFQALLP